LIGTKPMAPGGPTDGPPPPGVRRALAPLLVDPAHTAIVSDFDGTLSPIVDDPAGARAVPGTAAVLARLADRFAVVAVVSGRPASFLVEQLGASSVSGAEGSPGPQRNRQGVQFVGLYGLERSGQDGSIRPERSAERWRTAVEAATLRLASAAPTGVVVEPKGLAVTVHWRQAPGAAEWAQASATAEAARTGLRAHLGRMSVELRPNVDIDKGTVTRQLTAGCSAACYLGDDLGDLPAFAALAELSRSGGMATVSIAVADDESAPEVLEAADLSVNGPAEALQVLEWLAEG
jgi:trehalose 6-phosphate phosphatase